MSRGPELIDADLRSDPEPITSVIILVDLTSADKL
jgi:hypothetical protein